MLTRAPINGLTPRTEREAARDQFDWWEAPARRSWLATVLAAINRGGHVFVAVVAVLGVLGLIASSGG